MHHYIKIKGTYSSNFKHLLIQSTTTSHPQSIQKPKTKYLSTPFNNKYALKHPYFLISQQITSHIELLNRSFSIYFYQYPSIYNFVSQTYLCAIGTQKIYLSIFIYILFDILIYIHEIIFVYNYRYIYVYPATFAKHFFYIYIL